VSGLAYLVYYTKRPA